MISLLTRYDDKIQGILGCYDRIILQGNLDGIGYADGMTSFLYSRGIRIFDYKGFAQSLRDQIRTNAQKIADEAVISIQYITRKGVRKESLVREWTPAYGCLTDLIQDTA